MGVAAMTNLEGWVAETLERLREGEVTYDSVHLNEIGLPWDSWLMAQAAMLQAASLVPDTWDGRVAVWLPLESSVELMTDMPTEPELLASEIEPPSVYLESGTQPLEFQDSGERFVKRCHLPWVAENVGVELISSRTEWEISMGWEFTNGLLLYYFPGKAKLPE